jgi:hypothetical protein
MGKLLTPTQSSRLQQINFIFLKTRVHMKTRSANGKSKLTSVFNVRFQVLTAASMKIRAFIARMTETVSTSETSVYYNETTRRNIP